MAKLKPLDQSRSVFVHANGDKIRGVNIRMPLDLFKELEAVAGHQTRSITTQVLHYVKLGLAADRASRAA